MCILFLYTNPNPKEGQYRLIVASNRDEFYRRPAKKAFLCSETNIIGGRDMEDGREGGMWLGVTTKNSGNEKKICFGALLNLTGEERKSGVEGRGYIVTNYLKNNQTLDEYLKDLQKINHNAFNLVSVELSEHDAVTVHYTNIGQIKHVYSGEKILGFGNSPVATPLTKVKNGVRKFEEIIKKEQSMDNLVNELLELLKCPDKHLPDPQLQKRAPNAYEHLSSIFVSIKEGGYGSRTHSIILVDYNWNIHFVEHTLREPIDPNNPEWDVSCIKSQL